MYNWLKHYGVLGQKWGIRRRSVTPSSDHSSVRALRKKSVSELSDAELKKVASRMELEKRYKDAKKNSRSATSKLLSKIGSSILDKSIEAVSAVAVAKGKTLVEQALKDYDAAKLVQKIAEETKKIK